MEVDLVRKWGAHLDALKAAGKATAGIPPQLFTAKELVWD